MTDCQIDLKNWAFSDLDSDELEQLGQSAEEESGDEEEMMNGSDGESQSTGSNDDGAEDSEESDSLDQKDIVEDFTFSDSD